MNAVHVIGDAIDAVDAIMEVMRSMQVMRWFKPLGKKTLCARCRFRGIINSIRQGKLQVGPFRTSERHYPNLASNTQALWPPLGYHQTLHLLQLFLNPVLHLTYSNACFL